MYERFVSATGRLSFYEMVSAASSLPTKIPFPHTETTAGRDSVRACVRLLRRKVEQLVLAGPLRQQIGEASNAHAMGEPAIDGGFDQIGHEESQRDCHVDLSRAAVFSLGYLVRTRCRISDQFHQANDGHGQALSPISPASPNGSGEHAPGGFPSGRRISRRRLAGVFRQGTTRVLGDSASWMTNWPG